MIRGVDESLVPWLYEGVCGQVTYWFRLPEGPPTLPIRDGRSIQRFHPAAGWLRYLKLFFWLGLTAIDGAILIGWLAVLLIAPLAGVILAPFAFAVAVLPDIVVYIALHLQYDNTWYVLSDTSLRIRSGVWVIKEMTITFENVQNVSVKQGPIQRYYGIADVVVETAGGGQQPHGKGKSPLLATHEGKIEGVDNADEIRELIVGRMQRSRSAGLGDEKREQREPAAGWSRDHTAALREIRDLLNDYRL
ncbi:MAG: PH domain-containing protein [Candidatus Hydrogenedentota bacterium]